MKTIVLNCGSSSIKYQLFDMPEATVLAKGLVEKIGIPGSIITHKRNDGQKTVIERDLKNHQEGIAIVLDLLTNKETGSVQDISEICAVGHRVVHAGEKFSGSVLITNAVIDALKECVDLAPLHNPANLEGIFAMQKVLPNIPQVGVFDTAFHQTMPAKAYLYGLPYELYEKYGVRRYGFHGTSHKYVSRRACQVFGLDINKQKIITCHLGNGGSITAIDGGKSIDTSMGMTPIEGVLMGTRCGDLDVGALLFVGEKEKLDNAGLNKLVNKQAGMQGISGVSSDMRDIETAAKQGNKRAETSLEMYQYRVKKYIGAYAAAMGGVDMIIFTGGIGENDCPTRAKSLEGLEFMGVKIDMEKCLNSRGKEEMISTPDSKVKVAVIPTDEELMIATDTYEIVTKK